jgi:hypothetical protein
MRRRRCSYGVVCRPSHRSLLVRLRGEPELEMLCGHSQGGGIGGSLLVKTSSTSLMHVKARPGSSLDIGLSLVTS